jgi:hypothetical protein
MAVYTFILTFSLGVIITFEIEGLRHPEDIARAVIDTELTALASLFNYSDPTLCDLNGLDIKWNTPIFHLNARCCLFVMKLLLFNRKTRFSQIENKKALASPWLPELLFSSRQGPSSGELSGEKKHFITIARFLLSFYSSILGVRQFYG